MNQKKFIANFFLQNFLRRSYFQSPVCVTGIRRVRYEVAGNLSSSFNLLEQDI